MIGIVHVTDEVLAPLRARYGDPLELSWASEISEREHALATYDPRRMHDVTLFILDPDDRIALIRKPHFEEGVWRPPGGGIKRGEDFVRGAEREGYEETGLRVSLARYLVASRAAFLYHPYDVPWRTHVFLARTDDRELAPQDLDEIAAARWGTLDELGGTLRRRLLETGHAFWRYRVALHDAALEALRRPETPARGRAPAGST
jgi:ADP-ribose pyrophosphatase YjhB (NUDIX family)